MKKNFSMIPINKDSAIGSSFALIGTTLVAIFFKSKYDTKIIEKAIKKGIVIKNNASEAAKVLRSARKS